MFDSDKQLHLAIAAMVIPLVALVTFSVSTSSAELEIEPQVNEQAKYDVRDESYRGRTRRL